MDRIIDETLKNRDLMLINLYSEVLHRLDLMLESGDPKERNRAIDHVLDLVLARRTKGGYPMIAQYFNVQPQGQGHRPRQSIDELIIQRRREIELLIDKKTE
jgi:hypothetical protein